MAAVVIILALALPWQRRTAALPGLLLWQALAVAAVCALQLWQGDAAWWPGIAAPIVLLIYGMTLPLLLRRVLIRLPAAAETDGGLAGNILMLLLCASLCGLAVVIANLLAPLPWRANFAVALLAMLLGLLTMATRRATAFQLAGLLCLLHGVLLGAVTAIGPPHG
jgi:hydrogenase-4 membrane subunit HyfE